MHTTAFDTSPEHQALAFLALPGTVNLGNGRDWRPEFLNVDANPMWEPDLILDLNRPLPFGEVVHSDRFGQIRLVENQFDTVIAFGLLEHLANLNVAMTSVLQWLKFGGRLIVDVPYDLSLGAWQDPTHVRAFNENSWLYYTEWHWYLGWNEARFDLVERVFLLSEFGKSLQDKGAALEELLRQPRAVDGMKVVLQKRLLTEVEREFGLQFQRRKG
ncbi:MAG: methyltransferase domain-containing protein [Magnetococcales bacterium]|nr:methyltransferase domain-containing protein [Magnetococcales bacterium]